MNEAVDGVGVVYSMYTTWSKQSKMEDHSPFMTAFILKLG